MQYQCFLSLNRNVTAGLELAVCLMHTAALPKNGFTAGVRVTIFTFRVTSKINGKNNGFHSLPASASSAF
jgi:hypothetical protein